MIESSWLIACAFLKTFNEVKQSVFGWVIIIILGTVNSLCRGFDPRLWSQLGTVNTEINSTVRICRHVGPANQSPNVSIGTVKQKKQPFLFRVHRIYLTVPSEEASAVT